jgi:outer membrane lipoprotein-sorting protein
VYKEVCSMKSAIAFLLFAMLSVLPGAQAFSQSFSAEAIQTAPGMQSTNMQLHISRDKSVRIEMNTPQGKIVQQYFSATGLMRVIYPARKEYIEQKSPEPLSMPGDVVMNPCDNLPDAKCENLGEESINNQPAIHWKLTRQGPNQQLFTIEQWLDKKRGITLREKLPNGSSINAVMTGNEKINGREAERWEVTMTTLDGKTQSGTRWYDVELGITVREAFPNGSLRELKNIVVKEPDASLFMVPEGYRKINVPAQPPQGR